VRLAKINTETEQALAARYNIRSIPTLKLFVQGREVANQAGAIDSRSIVNWVQSKLQ
jgi:thioredoxin 2